MAELSTTKQRSIPGGKVFFDPYNETTGVYEGEQYIGLTPGFTVSVASTKVQSFSSEAGLRTLDDETLTQVLRTGNLTCRQISLSNLARFLIGTIDALAQGSGSVTDEAFTVRQDRYYQLGKTTANPSGVRSVSEVTVGPAPSGTAFVVDTDYVLDADLGRIYIVPGGGIADDTDILVDYTKAAKTRDRIKASALAQITGALRFIAYPAKGTARDLYAPLVTLSPAGDAVFKADDANYIELGWDLSFAEGPNGEAALVIDGRPY